MKNGNCEGNYSQVGQTVHTIGYWLRVLLIMATRLLHLWSSQLQTRLQVRFPMETAYGPYWPFSVCAGQQLIGLPLCSPLLIRATRRNLPSAYHWILATSRSAMGWLTPCGCLLIRATRWGLFNTNPRVVTAGFLEKDERIVFMI